MYTRLTQNTYVKNSGKGKRQKTDPTLLSAMSKQEYEQLTMASPFSSVKHSLMDAQTITKIASLPSRIKQPQYDEVVNEFVTLMPENFVQRKKGELKKNNSLPYVQTVTTMPRIVPTFNEDDTTAVEKIFAEINVNIEPTSTIFDEVFMYMNSILRVKSFVQQADSYQGGTELEDQFIKQGPVSEDVRGTYLPGYRLAEDMKNIPSLVTRIYRDPNIKVHWSRVTALVTILLKWFVPTDNQEAKFDSIIAELNAYVAAARFPFTTTSLDARIADGVTIPDLSLQDEDFDMLQDRGVGVDYIPLFTVDTLNGRGAKFQGSEPFLLTDCFDYEAFTKFKDFDESYYSKDTLVTSELDILTSVLHQICYGWCLDFIKVVTIMVYMTQQYTSTQGKSVEEIIQTLFSQNSYITSMLLDPMIQVNTKMMDDVAKVNETGHTSSFPIHILSTISQRAPLAINVTTYTLAQLKAMCPTYVQSSQWYADNGYIKIREGGTLTVKPSHTLEYGSSRLDSYVRLQLSSPNLKGVEFTSQFKNQTIKMKNINIARFANCSPTFIRAEYDTDSLNAYLEDKYRRTGQDKFRAEKEALTRTSRSMREAFLMPSLSIFNPKEMVDSINQLLEVLPLKYIRAAIDRQDFVVHKTTNVTILASEIPAPVAAQAPDVDMNGQAAAPIANPADDYKPTEFNFNNLFDRFLVLFPRFESELYAIDDTYERATFVYTFCDYFVNLSRTSDTITQFIDPSYTVPYSRFLRSLTIVTFTPSGERPYWCSRTGEGIRYADFISPFVPNGKTFTASLKNWVTPASPQYVKDFVAKDRSFSDSQLTFLNHVKGFLIRGSQYRAYDATYRSVTNWGFRLSQLLTRKFVLPNMTILKFVQPPVIAQAVPTQGSDFFRNSIYSEMKAKYQALRQDVISYQIHKALGGEDISKLPKLEGDPFIELKQQKQFESATQLYHSRQLLHHFTKVISFKLDSWIRPMLSTSYLWQKVHQFYNEVMYQLCDVEQYKTLLRERIPNVQFGKGLYTAFDLHQPIVPVNQETVEQHITRMVALLREQLKPLYQTDQLFHLQYSQYDELAKADFSKISPALGLLVLQQAFYLTKRGAQEVQTARRDIINSKFEQLFPGKDPEILGLKDTVSPYVSSLRNYVGRLVKSFTQYVKVYRGNQYIVESFLESVLGFSLTQLSNAKQVPIKAAFVLAGQDFRTNIFKQEYCASGKSYYAYQQQETLARIFELYQEKWGSLGTVFAQTFSKNPRDCKTVQDVVKFFAADAIDTNTLVSHYLRIVNGLNPEEHEDELHLLRIMLTLRSAGEKSPATGLHRMFEAELGSGQAIWSLYDSTQTNYIYDPVSLQFEHFLYTRKRPEYNRESYEGNDQQPYIIPMNVGVKRTMTWIEQLKAQILPSLPNDVAATIRNTDIRVTSASTIQTDTALLQLLQFTSEVKAMFEILYVSYQTCSFKQTNDYEFRQVLLMFQSYFANIKISHSDTVWSIPQGKISLVMTAVNEVFTHLSLMPVRNVREKQTQVRLDAPPKVDEVEMKGTGVSFEEGVQNVVKTRYAYQPKATVNYTGVL